MPRRLASDTSRRSRAVFARASLVFAVAASLVWGSEGFAAPPSERGSPRKPAAGQGDGQGLGAEGSSGAERSASLLPRGVLDPERGLIGRWQRDLEYRRQLLRQDAKGPRGVVGLLGVLDVLEGEVPTEDLRALLDAASRPGTDPRVASYAGWLHARLDTLVGDRTSAKARLEREGHVLDWLVVGPFDNDGDGGHDTAHAPETTSFERGQSFEGEAAGEPLGWRARSGSLHTGGFVALDEILRPTRQVTGYATTEIDVPRAGTFLVHVGSTGPYRVWIDGVEIGANDAHREAHPLQDAHAVWLASGRHRVLVKSSVREGAWGFFFRVSDERGRGTSVRAGTSLGTEPSTPERVASSGKAQAKAGGESTKAASVRALGPSAKALLKGALRPALAAAVRGDSPRAADLLALAEFDRHVRPFSAEDTTDVDLARRASDVAGTAHAALVLALIERDQNRSRQALDLAVTRARKEGERSKPLLAKALLELSARHEALGQHERAREYVVEAMRLQPDDALAELVALDRIARSGLVLASLRGIEDVARRYPDVVVVQEARAQRLEQLGDLAGTAAVLDALAARRPGDVGLASRRLELSLRRGDLRAARTQVEVLAALLGDTPQAWQERGRIALAEQDLPASIAKVDAALELAPQDADLHALRGHLVAMNGDVASGLVSFRRSLALRPQQPGLRDVVAALDPQGGGDFATQHLLDLETLAKQPVPDAWKGKDAAILAQQIAVHVLPNGLEERVEQRVIRILDERGIRNQAMQATVFDPAESTVEVRRTRVRRADGSIEDLGKARVTSLAEAGYRMFYDQRQLSVEMPGLRVGDVIEVVFVRRDVAARNMFDDYFGDIMPLAGLEPRGLVRYVLVAPSKMALHFNQPASAVQKTVANDGTTTWIVERRDVPSIKPEGGMPGWTEVVDYLHVSTYATWDDVARWYWRLVEGQLVADAAIQRAVADVLTKLPRDATVEQKVDAIYEHVVRSTRYVGLEFGIHGYKPYRTTEVYERRFGDCKDKASLLKVMLAQAGIESHLVLVRTKDQGRVGEAPASLSAFNHAIAYVPALDRYLDGTAEWSGARELPANDQGASVLVVLDGKGGRFTEIPFAPPAENREVLEREVTLASDGAAKISQRARIVGASASSHRVRLAAPDTRSERLEQIWSSVFAGAKLGGVENVVVDRINEPVSFDLSLDVPNFAQAQAGSLRFFVRGTATSIARQLAPQPTRALPLTLANTLLEETHTRFTLPPGWRFAHQPESRRLDSPFGRFQLDVKPTDAGADVDTTLELRVVRIDPSEYKAFREFLRSVDAALAQTFEAEPLR